MYIVGPDDIVSGLLEWKLVLMVSADYPQMEDLCSIDQVVLVADLLCQFLNFVSRISGYNTVYQSAAEVILCLDPVFELIAQLPEISILQNTLL